MTSCGQNTKRERGALKRFLSRAQEFTLFANETELQAFFSQVDDI